MKLRQNSQKYSFRESLYSGGKGEKYHVSISYLPSSIVAIFFTFVNSSCSRKLAASSSSWPYIFLKEHYHNNFMKGLEWIKTINKQAFHTSMEIQRPSNN